MKTIKIDAAHWKTGLDFYDAILPAIGAPDWHGTSVNALVDSMVWGNFNAQTPPYTVGIHSAKNLAQGITQELSWLKEGIIATRSEYRNSKGRDIEVYFKFFK